MTDCADLIVTLFLGAEHDHARIGMWLDLTERLGLPSSLMSLEDRYGLNMDDVDWEREVRAVLAKELGWR